MAEVANITPAPAFAPLEIVENVQIWLSQASAVLRLATDAIGGNGEGQIALGAAEDLVARSLSHLEGASVAMLAAGVRRVG